MRFNIISNINNQHGLQREYEILRYELERWGHHVEGVQFNAPFGMKIADVNIFIETVMPLLFEKAAQQWVIPHPEWWLPEYGVCLPYVDQVLCKTHDCFRLFKPLVGEKATYIGFMSLDWCRPDILKQDKFLHVAGKSTVKNTTAIIEAWRELPYHLTIVTSLRSFVVAAQTPMITVRPWVKDDELCRLYNECRFHLCPSEYEGYGHALHEGMGCGALVITTDAPPMNEFHTPEELLLAATPERKLCLATMQKVQAGDVRAKVRHCMSLSYSRKEELSRHARSVFEHNRQEFQEHLLQLIDRVC